MKKILTILTFVFMTSALLFGQCADTATPNSNHKFFNMDYIMQADRDAALVGLESITYPAGPRAHTRFHSVAPILVQDGGSPRKRHTSDAALDVPLLCAFAIPAPPLFAGTFLVT